MDVYFIIYIKKNTLKMISISLIDYIGKLEDGVGVILSLILHDKPYEIIYWFNKKDEMIFKIDDNFYKDYPEITNIYEYEYLIDLLYHIDTELLPSREEIWKEFLEDPNNSKNARNDILLKKMEENDKDKTNN